MNKHRLELLNSEGPILTVVKTNESPAKYDVIDQFKEIFTLTREEIFDFLEGRAMFADSHERLFDYVQLSADMKPSADAIGNFFEIA